MMLLPVALAFATLQQPTIYRVQDHYRKIEYMIPMRDGVKLYCAAYVPKDVRGKHPILMERTPYSAGPYGPDAFKGIRGSQKLKTNGYIFAFEDVRGKHMSEGEFVNVKPELMPGQKIDESTDTWDTVDFLVKNVPDNNGAVGLWGISYPGFYAGAGGINSHPALKAISPQAPVSDWFIGDDMHHNGAFFMQDDFDFFSGFGTVRPGPAPNNPGLPIDKQGKSAYDFFLSAGPLENLDAQYLKGRIPFWTEQMQHGTYDAYWKARSLPAHMKNVKCAVLTVGGWFDAEDMWGALNLYKATERMNPGTANFLVMGPWFHGMWAGRAGGGQTFGDLDFGMPTSTYFVDNIEFSFFEKYLRGDDLPAPAEATVFETGSNKWRTFPEWPPKGLGRLTEYMWVPGAQPVLSTGKPVANGANGVQYVYDPAKPTPYLADFLKSTRRTREYMIDDQRWAEGRSDVASYSGPVLDRDVTVAGPVDVDLWVTTTGTDADFVVKVIDGWPDDSKEKSPRGVDMAGYEQNVRCDIMRGKFRDSFETPKPFVVNQPTRIHFKLNDLLHTFKKGHRIRVQIQSSWFPLVDRNPNKFMDIYRATAADFQAATITILGERRHPSSISFGTLTR